MKVALLGPATWPEVRRGAERMFRDLAGGLHARGHEATLITSHRGPSGRTVEDGVEVLRSRRPPDARLLRRGYEEHLLHVPASYLALRRGSFDIANASHAPDALAAARWHGPAVFSFMGIPDRSWLVARRGRLEIMRRAIAACDAVVALSHAAADAFVHDLGVHARVIHPGVDVARFTPGGERSPEPSILCLASLDVAEKRVHLLLDALPLVRRAEPEATLMLQRPREPRIAAAATAIAGVELVDPEPPALPGLYRRAWISALPSRSDAFGLVLAESLACGTAVVGSDRGGIREIVDRPAVGRIFSGEHPRDVAAALLEGLELARDPVTAAACRARAEELSVERMVAEYEALYRELV